MSDLATRFSRSSPSATDIRRETSSTEKNKLKQAVGRTPAQRGRRESSNCGTVKAALLGISNTLPVPIAATPPNFPSTRLDSCIWVGISVRYQGTRYTAPRTHMMPKPRKHDNGILPQEDKWRMERFLGKNRRRSRGMASALARTSMESSMTYGALAP